MSADPWCVDCGNDIDRDTREGHDDDPMVEDVIKLADYIVTGHITRDVRVLPSEDLIEQVVKRAADVTSNLLTPDAAHYGTGDSTWRSVPEDRG